MRCLIFASLMILGLSCSAAELTVNVVDASGKPLADAVILVDSDVQGPRPASRTEATVGQENLRFQPAVTIVGIGAKLTFSNLDSWDHHVILGPTAAGGVYVDPGQNTQLLLPGRSRSRPPATASRVLTQPGAYLLGCHLHASMRGHIYVADTPWASIANEDGRSLFADLPVGPARIRLWHPDQLVEGTPTAIVVTARGSVVTIATQIMPVKKKRPAAAADPYFGLSGTPKSPLPHSA